MLRNSLCLLEPVEVYIEAHITFSLCLERRTSLLLFHRAAVAMRNMLLNSKVQNKRGKHLKHQEKDQENQRVFASPAVGA